MKQQRVMDDESRDGEADKSKNLLAQRWHSEAESLFVISSL